MSKQGIQIVYRPEDYNQDEMGVKIDEQKNNMREETTTEEIIEDTTTEDINEETTTEKISEETTTEEIIEETTREEIIEETTTIQAGSIYTAMGPRSYDNMRNKIKQTTHEIDEEEYARRDNIWKSLIQMMHDHPELMNKWL